MNPTSQGPLALKQPKPEAIHNSKASWVEKHGPDHS